MDADDMGDYFMITFGPGLSISLWQESQYVFELNAAMHCPFE